jgi:hypothetical protein
MTDYRALCARMADELDHYRQLLMGDRRETHALATEARAALAQPEPVAPTDEELVELFNENDWNYISPETFIDIARAVLECWGNYTTKPDGPAVPHGREPASVADQPTDKELLDLMPETMRDEFSYAAKVCSDATGGQVKPGIFRVALNTAALEYARAVFARWGRPAIEPVPVAERLPGPTDKGLDASRYLKYIEELSDVLVSCSEMLSEWGTYADEYYQKKHCLDADVAYAKSHAARAKRVAEQTDRLGEYDD